MRTTYLTETPFWLAINGYTHRAYLVAQTSGRAPSDRLIIWDTRTGTRDRSVTLAGIAGLGGITPLAVDQHTGHVFLAANGVDTFLTAHTGTNAGVITMIDGRSGAVLRGPHDINPGPGVTVIDPQTRRLFIASTGFTVASGPTATVLGSGLTIINTHTGAIVSRRPLVGVLGIALDERVGHLLITTTGPTTTVGTVLNWTGGTVQVRDAGSGHLLHVTSLPGLLSRPVATLAVDERTGRTFIPERTGVAVVDDRTGRLVRTVALGGVPLALAVDPRTGHVFATVGLGVTGPPSFPSAFGAGRVVMLDGRDGQLLHAVPLTGIGWSLAVDGARGRVLVADTGGHTLTPTSGTPSTTSGRVVVLDAATGVLRHTLTMPGPPIQIAVDEQAGRALVVSDVTAPVRASDPWGWVPQWLRARVPFFPPARVSRSTVAASLSVIDTTRL